MYSRTLNMLYYILLLPWFLYINSNGESNYLKKDKIHSVRYSMIYDKY